MGRSTRRDVVVDNPHVAVAKCLDAFKLERAVTLLACAFRHPGSLASFAVAGLACTEANPSDFAFALAHVTGATHTHRITSWDCELVEFKLHGGAAGYWVSLGRDLHGYDIRQGMDDGRVGRWRGKLLLLLEGRGRCYGGSSVGVGQCHDGVVIDIILGLVLGRRGVCLKLGLLDRMLWVLMLVLRRRRRWLLLLLLLLLMLLMLVLGAQRALTRGCSNVQATLPPKDGLELGKALLDVGKTLVDYGVDALVDDGGDGVGQG